MLARLPDHPAGVSTNSCPGTDGFRVSLARPERNDLDKQQLKGITVRSGGERSLMSTIGMGLTTVTLNSVLARYSFGMRPTTALRASKPFCHPLGKERSAMTFMAKSLLTKQD